MLDWFNFPTHLTKLIMSCISDPNLAIIVNVSASDSFQASRGISQGDPISPYLFILCMEYLSLSIDNECFARNWDPIRIARNEPKISHLFFADDIILVAKANEKNCSTILDTLDDFCFHSGQKVNYEKSKVWFSPMVTDDRAFHLNSILKLKKVQNLGIYLGHPLARFHPF